MSTALALPPAATVPVHEETAAARAPAHRPWATTLVHIGGPAHDDGSFLLIRRRHPGTPAGHLFRLCGDFRRPVSDRLREALAAVPADGGPLTIDLQGVTHLDDGCAGLLLQARRARSPRRPFVFRARLTGATRRLLPRPGLGDAPGEPPSDSRWTEMDKGE